jgi:hypothetical protein
VTAFLAVDLISSLIVHSNKHIAEYLLKYFLQKEIIAPLIEGESVREDVSK